MNLSQDVLDALRQERMIDAIKLLRAETGLGLKEAKAIVDQYLDSGDTQFSMAPALKNPATPKRKVPVLGLMVLAALIWAMVNAVAVAGSLIVIWHHGGYRKTVFTVDRVHYHNDHESGLTWGFVGRIPDRDGEIRMYAPGLADGKALGAGKLRRMYLPGTKMAVWYNPQVTATLFQHRTLYIIPFAPDIIKTEMAVINRWMMRCLLPLAAVLFFARVREKF